MAPCPALPNDRQMDWRVLPIDKPQNVASFFELIRPHDVRGVQWRVYEWSRFMRPRTPEGNDRRTPSRFTCAPLEATSSCSYLIRPLRAESVSRTLLLRSTITHRLDEVCSVKAVPRKSATDPCPVEPTLPEDQVDQDLLELALAFEDISDAEIDTQEGDTSKNNMKSTADSILNLYLDYPSRPADEDDAELSTRRRKRRHGGDSKENSSKSPKLQISSEVAETNISPPQQHSEDSILFAESTEILESGVIPFVPVAPEAEDCEEVQEASTSNPEVQWSDADVAMLETLVSSDLPAAESSADVERTVSTPNVEMQEDNVREGAKPVEPTEPVETANAPPETVESENVVAGQTTVEEDDEIQWIGAWIPPSPPSSAKATPRRLAPITGPHARRDRKGNIVESSPLPRTLPFATPDSSPGGSMHNAHLDELIKHLPAVQLGLVDPSTIKIPLWITDDKQNGANIEESGNLPKQVEVPTCQSGSNEHAAQPNNTDCAPSEASAPADPEHPERNNQQPTTGIATREVPTPTVSRESESLAPISQIIANARIGIKESVIRTQEKSSVQAQPTTVPADVSPVDTNISTAGQQPRIGGQGAFVPPIKPQPVKPINDVTVAPTVIESTVSATDQSAVGRIQQEGSSPKLSPEGSLWIQALMQQAPITQTPNPINAAVACQPDLTLDQVLRQVLNQQDLAKVQPPTTTQSVQMPVESKRPEVTTPQIGIAYQNSLANLSNFVSNIPSGQQQNAPAPAQIQMMQQYYQQQQQQALMINARNALNYSLTKLSAKQQQMRQEQAAAYQLQLIQQQREQEQQRQQEQTKQRQEEEHRKQQEEAQRQELIRQQQEKEQWEKQRQEQLRQEQAAIYQRQLFLQRQEQQREQKRQEKLHKLQEKHRKQQEKQERLRQQQEAERRKAMELQAEIQKEKQIQAQQEQSQRMQHHLAIQHQMMQRRFQEHCRKTQIFQAMEGKQVDKLTVGVPERFSPGASAQIDRYPNPLHPLNQPQPMDLQRAETLRQIQATSAFKPPDPNSQFPFQHPSVLNTPTPHMIPPPPPYPMNPQMIPPQQFLPFFCPAPPSAQQTPFSLPQA